MATLDPQVQPKVIEISDTMAVNMTDPEDSKESQVNTYLKQFKKIYGELTKVITA
jgi:hypothetical protein